VNDQDYQVPFKFDGKLDKLTNHIDRPHLTPADEKILSQKSQRNSHANSGSRLLTPQRRLRMRRELKKFAQELSLSDTQKEQLRTHLADKYARLQEFLKQNANISRTELVQKIVSIRGSLREQVVKFLTPQQLAKWDAEVARAKEFLGQKIAA
jgi:periplasmic protein CpxP/Spy